MGKKRKRKGKKNNHKKEILVTLVVVVASFVFILGYFLFFNDGTRGSQDDIVDTSDFSVEVGRAYSSCEQIQDDSKRYSCYYGVILETNDPDTCSKFMNSAWKSRCISDFSILRNDLGLCEQAPDVLFRENCYLEIASRTNNPEICGKIVERVEIIDLCYVEANR